MSEQDQVTGIEGGLDVHPFPKLLQFLYERGATGRLALRRGELTKVIFLVEGRPVNVDSTLRDETLGQYLIKKGKISDEDYERSIQLMIDQGMQQGAALVKMGVLSARDLYHEVKNQTREKLLSCFSWTKGTFGFYPEIGFVEDIYRFETSVPRAMYEGIFRFYPPGAVEAQLAKVELEPIAPTPLLAERLAELDLNDHETSVVFMVTGDKDLLELKRATRSYPHSQKLLYLLLVSGLIGPRGEPAQSIRGLGDLEQDLPPVEQFIVSPSEEAPEVVETMEIEVEAPAEEPPPPGDDLPAFGEEPPAPAEEEDIFAAEDQDLSASPPEEDIFSSDEQMGQDDPTPPPRVAITEEEVIDDWGDEGVSDSDLAGPPQGKAQGFDDDEVLGVGECDLGEDEPIGDRSGEDESEAGPPPRDESEILEFYMNLKGGDFFELLNVDRTADDAAIHMAYRTLREEWDRKHFGGDLGNEAMAKLEEIQAQFIRAYEALRTEDARAEYLEQQGRKVKPAGPDRKLQAEQFLQQGIAFVRKRDWAQAQKMFEQAVEASPNEPEYVGYLGWTVYSNQELDLTERRERAKELLRQAIDLNPHKDSTHVFLGKILKDEGSAPEALEEFQTALRWNPGCKEAEREIRSHEQGEW